MPLTSDNSFMYGSTATVLWCVFQDLLKTLWSIRVKFLSSFFSIRFERVPVVHLYSITDTATPLNKSRFILAERSDSHMIDNLPIMVCKTEPILNKMNIKYEFSWLLGFSTNLLHSLMVWLIVSSITTLATFAIFWRLIYFCFILLICEFFTPVLPDGFPLDSELQESLQDSSWYSSRYQQCCSLNCLHLSSYFQVHQSLSQSFVDCTKRTNYNWYYRQFHVPKFFIVL